MKLKCEITKMRDKLVNKKEIADKIAQSTDFPSKKGRMVIGRSCGYQPRESSPFSTPPRGGNVAQDR